MLFVFFFFFCACVSRRKPTIYSYPMTLLHSLPHYCLFSPFCICQLMTYLRHFLDSRALFSSFRYTALYGSLLPFTSFEINLPSMNLFLLPYLLLVYSFFHSFKPSCRSICLPLVLLNEPVSLKCATRSFNQLRPRLDFYLMSSVPIPPCLLLLVHLPAKQHQYNPFHFD